MRLWSIICVAVGASEVFALGGVTGLKVPPGFVVEEYAGSDLADDIYTVSVDPKGRIAVAGRGYVRLLVDADGDGKAERFIQFADTPKDGAMGMYWEGQSLFVTGDGGLRRFWDRDKDDRADGPSELIRQLKTGGEHNAHAVQRGPDGWLYVLCGNYTGVDGTFAQLKTSPVKDPVGGCLIRFTPDLKKTEIVADGFRNAYGMDFNPEGEWFTYDSDNERCVSLPWYEPTRFYRVFAGGFHGWLSPQRAKWWRYPPYFFDVVAPVAYLGRGSPTGVACYRHVQFPQHYRGGFFACDWTFGRIWFVRPVLKQGSYTARKEIFLQALGDNGFAPTGIVVHPLTGDLFVSVGGRGTRGAVYRIRYARFKGKIDHAAVARLQPKKSPLPIVPTIRYIGSRPDTGQPHVLHEYLQRVERYVLYHGELPPNIEWSEVLEHPDRYVRQAAIRILRALRHQSVESAAKQFRSPRALQTLDYALVKADAAEVVAHALGRLKANPTAEEALTDIRLIQLALGGLVDRSTYSTVWEGYTLRNAKALAAIGKARLSAVSQILRRWLLRGDREIRIEAARTLAAIGDTNPESLAAVHRVASDTTDPVQTLHLLIVAARLPIPRTAKTRRWIVNELLELESRIRKAGGNVDRHWPLRVTELYRGLVQRDPQLHRTLIEASQFGAPEHALFALAVKTDRVRAARRFLARASRDPDYKWNSDVVVLLGSLPLSETRSVLARVWGEYGLEASLLPIFAQAPQPEDRPKFLAGLTSADARQVRLCVEALQKLPAKVDDELLTHLVLAMKRFPEKEFAPLRKEIRDYLRSLTGKNFGDNVGAWTVWIARKSPEAARRLSNPDGVDLEAWRKRLAAIQWNEGRASRGRLVFEKSRCLACHSGRRALGPDLKGVGQRFSRDDLLQAVIQPSRDVPARYQGTLLATTDGKVYQGLVVYEAADGLILQTSDGKTVRVAADQIGQRTRSRTSLMPAGLLDNLSNQEIADLIAYLKSLR